MRLTVLIFLTLSVTPLLGEESACDVVSAADARLASIEAEIDAIGEHEWAGAYTDGVDGGFISPRMLWIAPASGAVATQRGCMGEDANFGSVVLQDAILQIDWANPNRTGLAPTERELLVVPFRAHTYLVPKNGIHSFCIAVRTHGRQPMGVLRSVQIRSLPHDDEPRLPEEFQKFVDLPSIQAHIIAVEKQKRAHVTPDEDKVTQRIVLDVGSNHHVFVGMRFEGNGRDTPNHVVTIVGVEGDQSTAESSYYAEPGERVRAIRKRWVFQTASW